MSETRCPGCGALVPDISGPTHQYVPSAPGCWRVFGEVQADQLRRFAYPPAQRLVVDAYMAQHPGDGRDRRERQSVFVHLVALCAVLERALPADLVTRLMAALVQARADEVPLLAPPVEPGRLTVLHMVGSGDLDDYSRRAHEWSSAVWQAWSVHHARIRRAVDEVMRESAG